MAKYTAGHARCGPDCETYEGRQQRKYPDVALEMINSRTFDGRIQLLEYVPSVLSGPPLDRHGKRSQQFHVNVGRASARTGITNRKAADCRACRSMMLAGYSPLMLVAGDDPLAVAATRAVQGGDLEALRELLTALSILALRTPRLVTTIRVACADRCFTQLPTGPVTTQTTSSWWSC